MTSLLLIPTARILKSKRALSLFEVIIATVILALVISGLANLFISVKRFNLNSQLRMSGGELEKYQLSRFSAEVRQDEWDAGAKDYQAGNLLRKTASVVTEADFTLSTNPERKYTPTYAVSKPPDRALPADTPLRKVKFTLTWTE